VEAQSFHDVCHLRPRLCVRRPGTGDMCSSLGAPDAPSTVTCNFIMQCTCIMQVVMICSLQLVAVAMKDLLPQAQSTDPLIPAHSDDSSKTKLSVCSPGTHIPQPYQVCILHHYPPITMTLPAHSDRCSGISTLLHLDHDLPYLCCLPFTFDRPVHRCFSATNTNTHAPGSSQPHAFSFQILASL